MSAVEGSALVNIADVVIDVIDLQYHETVMGMGGDLAAKWLNDFQPTALVPPRSLVRIRSCSSSRAPSRTRRRAALGTT